MSCCGSGGKCPPAVLGLSPKAAGVSLKGPSPVAFMSFVRRSTPYSVVYLRYRMSSTPDATPGRSMGVFSCEAAALS